MASSVNFTAKYECAGCGDDIHGVGSLVRVQCVESGVVLCPECFAAGVEVGSHRAHHAYQFMDNGDFSPLDNDWTAKELVQLLDGLEQFGYGNWNDVSRYVGSSKTALECRDAVNNILVSGPIGSMTYKEALRGRAVDHTASSSAHPAPAASPAPANLSLHQLLALGFMPARDDFELEHDNEAEVLVSSIEAAGTAGGAGLGRLEPEEEQLEAGLKLAHVQMYQTKLRERERRKHVSKDLALVEGFFNSVTGKLSAPKPKKKDSKQELLDKFKFVASFQGTEEYKKVLAGMSKEREIKHRIKELHRYRKNGISQLQEAESYEAERIKRNKKKADRKKALEAGLPEPPSAEPSPVKDPAGGEGGKVTDLDNVTSILGLPGYEVLSHNERRLCTSLRLHPSLYISYKTCLLRDHLQKKKGQSPKPVHPSGLDKVHRRKIFNFLLHSGWISAY